MALVAMFALTQTPTLVSVPDPVASLVFLLVLAAALWVLAELCLVVRNRRDQSEHDDI